MHKKIKNMNVRKGFTLIELLIVIAIIGILAGIVIVSLSGSTDNAEDAATRANLRSVATLYAEVFGENNTAASLCLSEKAKAAMDTVFADGTPQDGTLGTNDTYVNDDADLSATNNDAADGCVSNGTGDWVVWSQLSDTEKAWCVDSSGKNGEVTFNMTTGQTPTIAIDAGSSGLAAAKAKDGLNCGALE